MKYLFLLAFTALLSACCCEDSGSGKECDSLTHPAYPANTDCLKLRVSSAFFDDYDEIEILGYIENISEEKFAHIYFADEYLCRPEYKLNDAESRGILQLWWEDFLFTENNGRWDVLWKSHPESSQFRFQSVMIQPRAKLPFRIRRLPVNGVYAEGWPENRLKKLKDADFKIIYDMRRFFPQKGNLNKCLESNVFKMLPCKQTREGAHGNAPDQT